MEKVVRCTVCVWRGSWADAQFAPRVSRSDIPPALESVQAAYDELHAAAAAVGQPPPPPCPMCGHHTKVVPRRPSIRPAV
jgi:hypothetical protein